MKRLLILISFSRCGGRRWQPRVKGSLSSEKTALFVTALPDRVTAKKRRNWARKPADLTKIAAAVTGFGPVGGHVDPGRLSEIYQPAEDMPVFEELLDNDMVEFDTGNGCTRSGSSQADRCGQLS